MSWLQKTYVLKYQILNLQQSEAWREPLSCAGWMRSIAPFDLEPETHNALMPDSRRFDPHHERQRHFSPSEIPYQESEIKRSETGTIQLEDYLLLVLPDTESLPFESLVDGLKRTPSGLTPCESPAL